MHQVLDLPNFYGYTPSDQLATRWRDDRIVFNSNANIPEHLWYVWRGGNVEPGFDGQDHTWH